ncbi:MAG TPA: GNVR domain-containing protein [Bryobacteraceae bacterium]|jgi:succinoglycan biosynthesis transport protein ExoP|nr:GNVR domain-containing protein [Bryobacteraceae bacterium]
MQPTEGMSIPRRTLDVEDYIDITRRHKGWIFGPFLFTLVVSVVGAYMWPDSYTSQAMIRIQPQQVPEEMVQAAVSQRMEQRMSAMVQTVESHSVLANIIQTFNLYPKLRAQEPVEDVIEEMKKKDLNIAQVVTLAGGGDRRSAPAYAITFSYENRFLAQKVVGELVSRLTSESIRNKTEGTYQTTEFIKEQRDNAMKELNEIETKLQAFQTENNGRLPDQLDSNVRQLQALQVQVANIGSQISRSNQDRLQLQSQIQIFKDSQTAIAKEQPIEQQSREFQQKNLKLTEAERDVQTNETQLNLLLQKYTDDWPDVRSARGRLAVAKQVRDELLKEDAATKKVDASATPAPKAQNPQQARDLRELDNRVRQLQTAVEAKDMEITALNKDMKRVNEQIGLYMGRVEALPAGERQYGDLLRDREIAKQKYVKLDTDLQKAQIAQDMEGRKQGETLELLDPASLPLNPTEPRRPLIVSIGAALGLLLGVVIAGALEMKDTSLKNLKDVRAYTKMAILGSIPLLENDFVVRRRKRLAWLGWTTASLVAVVIMSGSVVYYYVTKA